MNVDIPCPNCGTIFTVRSELLGKRTKCPKCSTVFTLVAPGGLAAEEPSPSFLPDSILPGAHASPPPQPPPAATRPQQTAAPTPQPATSPRELLGFESNPTRRRFPALRIVARVYEVAAVIVLVVALILFLFLVIEVIGNPSAFIAVMLGSGVSFLFAAATAIGLLFVAQLIRLLLQIEENTRDTQLACRQLANHLCAVEVEP